MLKYSSKAFNYNTWRFALRGFMSKNTIHVSTNDAIDHSSQSDNGSNNLPIYLGIDSYSIHIKTILKDGNEILAYYEVKQSQRLLEIFLAILILFVCQSFVAVEV